MPSTYASRVQMVEGRIGLDIGDPEVRKCLTERPVEDDGLCRRIVP